MSASIIKNRNFTFMWFGHLISHAGDAVFMIALPWLMLDITGSKSLTSLVSMSAYLPAVLFGLFAGVVVDRYNRKWIMIYSDILRALLVAVIPLSLIYGFISPLLIGAITFSLSTFSAFFYPARDSLIPHIVTAEELSGANSAISISGQMSHLLGPLFAGIGISIFGLRHLFTADAISFLFSILFISLIIDPARKLAIKKHPPKWQGIIEGLTYVKSNKGLRLLLILTFVNNLFIMGPAIIGLPVFVREVLTSDFGVLAKLEVAMASGMLMGSFVFWKAEKNISPISILLFGIVMDGITYTLLFFADTSSIAICV
jgi:MFS family permease